jgi:hypothetical protein
MSNSIKWAAMAAISLLVLSTGASAQLGSGKGRMDSAPMLGASPPIDCTVNSINAASYSFDCVSDIGHTVFNVFSSTQFSLGGSADTFFTLATGMKVEVIYHNSGSVLVTESVSAKP